MFLNDTTKKAVHGFVYSLLCCIISNYQLGFCCQLALPLS